VKLPICRLFPSLPVLVSCHREKRRAALPHFPFRFLLASSDFRFVGLGQEIVH
jgi:hypothetical protein